jgi:hypothetical protein
MILGWLPAFEADQTAASSRAGDPITPERATPGTSFDLVELLQRVFDEPEREAERRLEAVRRRREFRLVQGAKP